MEQMLQEILFNQNEIMKKLEAMEKDNLAFHKFANSILMNEEVDTSTENKIELTDEDCKDFKDSISKMFKILKSEGFTDSQIKLLHVKTMEEICQTIVVNRWVYGKK